MSCWDDPIRVGLPELPFAESLVEIINSVPNLNRMRKAIWEGQRDSALIRNAMTAAEINGFSGEDKYTYLAYHALVMAEKQHRELRKTWGLFPMPPFIGVSPPDPLSHPEASPADPNKTA